MPKMSKEERAELEARLAADDEADDDDDFEIEIYAADGSGARLPYRRGKSFLATKFGIDADTLPKPGASKKPAKSPAPAKGDDNSEGGEQDPDPNNLTFFQRRQAQREGNAS